MALGTFKKVTIHHRRSLAYWLSDFTTVPPTAFFNLERTAPYTDSITPTMRLTRPIPDGLFSADCLLTR